MFPYQIGFQVEPFSEGRNLEKTLEELLRSAQKIKVFVKPLLDNYAFLACKIGSTLGSWAFRNSPLKDKWRRLKYPRNAKRTLVLEFKHKVRNINSICFNLTLTLSHRNRPLKNPWRTFEEASFSISSTEKLHVNLLTGSSYFKKKSFFKGSKVSLDNWGFLTSKTTP